MSRAAPVAALALAIAALLAGGRAAGEPAVVPAVPHATRGVVDMGAGHAELSAGLPAWNDQYVRASLALTPEDLVNTEVSHQRHFGTEGTFLGLGYTRVLDPSWYAALSAGTSIGGDFLPRFRLDGAVSRKWLARRQLVTTLGFGYYRAKDVHFDVALLAGAIYYFDAPWIAEVGARLNDSNPGHARSSRAFAALTFGRNKHHYLTVRYDTGGEAYQVMALNEVLANFDSSEASFIWRQWLGADLGFNLRATRYVNPTYGRWGMELGIFQEF